MIAALLSQHISWDCVRDRKTYVTIFGIKGKHYKKIFLSKMRKLEIIKRLMLNLFLKLCCCFFAVLEKTENWKNKSKIWKRNKNNEVCAREIQPHLYY